MNTKIDLLWCEGDCGKVISNPKYWNSDHEALCENCFNGLIARAELMADDANGR